MSTRSLPSRRPLALSLAVSLAFTACAGSVGRTPADTDLGRAVDDLLAADRGFSAAAAGTDAVSAITAMLAADVMMGTPHGTFARNPSEVADVLRLSFGTAGSRVEWTPIRGGISADGQHGFTFGYGTLRKPDTASVPLKYLAYWVRHPEGWRVAAYNVRRRAPGDVSLAMMPPSLPRRAIGPTADSARIARHYESLVAAERAFSDRAQVIGLGPAFVENGSADAVNMGGRDSPSFVVGNEAIGRSIGAGAPQPTSPVHWGADRAIVASSGDLGVTFGIIRPHLQTVDAARPTGFPFFTIWRRPGARGRWRYVAE
jgi:hypothetical protein